MRPCHTPPDHPAHGARHHRTPRRADDPRRPQAPELQGAARRMAACIHALHVRIHTFYLKFLQGHT